MQKKAGRAMNEEEAKPQQRMKRVSEDAIVYRVFTVSQTRNFLPAHAAGTQLGKRKFSRSKWNFLPAHCTISRSIRNQLRLKRSGRKFEPIRQWKPTAIDS
ncbi:hypothetical protein NE237_021691 [Protea cynaroides]|uniref:Uncharacterized protein n=1 Tax=Protea cynaroides TaxID=273540 RepID=A0A9Q0HAP9_9MAGN|nr:hypothetical protein NE237_021691 [Protea cynaroides]